MSRNHPNLFKKFGCSPEKLIIQICESLSACLIAFTNSRNFAVYHYNRHWIEKWFRGWRPLIGVCHLVRTSAIFIFRICSVQYAFSYSVWYINAAKQAFLIGHAFFMAEWVILSKIQGVMFNRSSPPYAGKSSCWNFTLPCNIWRWEEWREDVRINSCW